MPTPNSNRLDKGLAFSNDRCDNYYVMSTTRQVVKEAHVELGHFSDPPLLVLASLADGPKHGHAMTKNIETMAGTKLSPGALYGAMARLEKRGLIEPLPAEERRHPYKITESGLAFLRAKLDTISRFANAGLKKLEAQ
jgi:DNA-binding PadR family transcriptional regulator